MKLKISAFVFFFSLAITAQELSVKKIMQDPKWMGTFPSNVEWTIDGKHILFDYNPDQNLRDSIYAISVANPDKIFKAPKPLKKIAENNVVDSYEKSAKYLLIEDGNLILYDLKKDKETILLDLDKRIQDAHFIDEDRISLVYGNNAYLLQMDNFQLKQLTQIKKAGKRSKRSNEDSSWLEEENISLIKYLQKQELRDSLTRDYRESQSKDKYEFNYVDESIYGITISPSLNAVAFNLYESEDTKRTQAADYVDKSGYTKLVNARPKVNKERGRSYLVVYNLVKDTAYTVSTDNLPGIKKQPEYLKEYNESVSEEDDRPVDFSGIEFSPDGENAVVVVRSQDNKDRWICLVDLNDGSLTSLDHQRDEAWIGGPGIGSYGGSGTIGWLPDNQHIYFQSEETGYSHLYILDVKSKEKTQLTSGDYEVFDPKISKDEKHWYLTASKGDFRQRHFYKMPLFGGKMVQLTKGIGKHEVQLSPDENYFTDLFSNANNPAELYLSKTKKNARPIQMTSGQSEEFSSYDWKMPDFISFEASDGAEVPARLYLPEPAKKNGAAVVFVHGAGYLQNAHKWWSNYYREYMFHNLLTDLGYTVLDIDYRASAGYGRDWRTGIYRHMGGKDLSDQVDGVKYLINQHGINPDKVGIYGGSYGGFITLMAMFNHPEVFTSGAALRSVTDWAHYNHGYTSNILNTPEKDPEAFRRSSPIYFAEGLQGHLLMCHGMMDTNVQFQDIVRLTQRLIELGKENWELAVYPVEGHGFTEPESWTDEYSRILKLFNETLLD